MSKAVHPSHEALITPEDSEFLRSRWVVLGPGKEVGEHTTGDREEVVVFVSGSALVEAAGEREEVEAPAAVFFPRNTPHNIKNIGQDPLIYAYVVKR